MKWIWKAFAFTFIRRFYPKRFRLDFFFCQYVCSLGIEPTTFELLTQCSTTEPQECSEQKQNVLEKKIIKAFKEKVSKIGLMASILSNLKEGKNGGCDDLIPELFII